MASDTEDNPFLRERDMIQETRFQTITTAPKNQNISQEELRLTTYEELGLHRPSCKQISSSSNTTQFGSKTTEPLISQILSSNLFEVRVGCEEYIKIYHVHEAALRQSPVLAAATEPDKWKEGKTRVLHLPDDDPRIFLRLLEYFYTGEFAPRISFVDGGTVILDTFSNTEAEPKILMDLLCLADKYCLTDMKREIVRKIKACAPTADTFLDLIVIADNDLPEDLPFCPFDAWAKEYIKSNYDALVQNSKFPDIIKAGGPLAWELFKARP